VPVSAPFILHASVAKVPLQTTIVDLAWLLDFQPVPSVSAERRSGGAEMEISFYGDTFDPFHLGHLKCAKSDISYL